MIRKIIGDAITKVIDDVGEMFLKKPGGKTQRVTDPDTAKKMIGDGAKVVSQAPIRNARGLTAREREAIAGLGGQAGGVARTISRGKTSIGELVKTGQRAKPRGMGDRKAVATRPKPPAKRGNTMPVPKPKPKPPVTARPTPKPPARAGGSGGGRPPGTAPRPMPGARPGQRPPRIVGTSRGAQAGTTARQAAILAQIQKNLEETSRGPERAPADPSKPKGKPTPNTKKMPPQGPPKAKQRPTPNTKKIDPRGRSVTAGKNVGFGPKGNIFPSNAEERKALMLMYGGTGSEAGKRAIAGKQGNIAKGRAAYEAAKRKRLTAKKKAGGSFSSKKIPIVTVGPKGGKNKGKVVGTANKVVKKEAGGKMSSETRARSRIYKAPKSPMTNAKPKIKKYRPTTKFPKATSKIKKYRPKIDIKPFSKGGKVARQVKGFGAARRPKK